MQSSENILMKPTKKIVNFDTYGYTLTDMIKELVNVSNSIYNYILNNKSKKNTYLLCVGQSPGYYALSMMNLPQYDQSKVKIIVLPYSGSVNPTLNQQFIYNKQLIENGIYFDDNEDEVILLDQAQHGFVLTNFIKTFTHFSSNHANYIILLNNGYQFSGKYIHKLPIQKHFSSSNLPRFSDNFPRIVQHYRPDIFETTPMIIGFINIDTNPFVAMIIECSKIFPNESIWYSLNHFIPKASIEAEIIYQRKMKELHDIEKNEKEEAENSELRNKFIELLKSENKYDLWIKYGSNWGLKQEDSHVFYMDINNEINSFIDIGKNYKKGYSPVFEFQYSNNKENSNYKNYNDLFERDPGFYEMAN